MPNDPTATRAPAKAKTGGCPARRRAPKAPAEVFRQVGREVLENCFDPVCWAQALAVSDGGHDETVAHYARIRTKEVAARLKEGREKEESRRERQLECFQCVTDVKTAWNPPMGRVRFLPGLVDSFFWHVVAVVGVISCLVAMAALWPAFRGSIGLGSILILAVALQAIPVLGWFAGRGFLNSMAYPQVVQVSACVSIALSLALGTYMLARPEIVQFPTRAVAPIAVQARPGARDHSDLRNGKYASTPPREEDEEAGPRLVANGGG